jgi:ribosomal protein L35
MLAHLFLRRQAPSRTALLDALDALKSITNRSFHDLSRAAAGSASYSISTITVSSPTTTKLPSLARLAPTAPINMTTSVWNIWSQCQSGASSSFLFLGGVRHASTVKVKPPFQGGKLKPYSAFKNRFKMTATGKIRYMRPGNVHKRHNKGRRQLQDLGETQVMQNTYSKTMKRLGFVMRRF